MTDHFFILGHLACSRLSSSRHFVSITNCSLVAIWYKKSDCRTRCVLLKNMIVIWYNDLELKYLELYKAEPVLWDTKHPHYKDKNKNQEAWIRISELMDISVPELKKKRDSIFASYRKYRKIVRESVTSGTGKVYKPVWFAYDVLESFLGKRQNWNETINTPAQESTTCTTLKEEKEDEVEEIFADPLAPHLDVETIIADEAEVQAEPVRNAYLSRRKNVAIKRRRFLNGATEKSIRHGSEPLMITCQKRTCEHEETDESSLYGQLLAKRLRALSYRRRKILINKIDNLVFNAEIEELDHSQQSQNITSISHPSPSSHTSDQLSENSNFAPF